MQTFFFNKYYSKNVDNIKSRFEIQEWFKVLFYWIQHYYFYISFFYCNIGIVWIHLYSSMSSVWMQYCFHCPIFLLYFHSDFNINLGLITSGQIFLLFKPNINFLRLLNCSPVNISSLLIVALSCRWQTSSPYKCQYFEYFNSCEFARPGSWLRYLHCGLWIPSEFQAGCS